MAALIGLQGIAFATVARRYATLRGLLPPSRYSRALTALNSERLLLVGAVLLVVSLVGLFWSLAQWVGVGFGPLEDVRILRVLTLSFTGLASSIELWLVAFLQSLMEIPQRPTFTVARAEPDEDGRQV
jgi:hypothetical protein